MDLETDSLDLTNMDLETGSGREILHAVRTLEIVELVGFRPHGLVSEFFESYQNNLYYDDAKK